MACERLAQLAKQFYETKLFDILNPRDVFAVTLSSGETGYCSVSHYYEEEPAICLYIGDSGLQSFRDFGGFSHIITTPATRRQMAMRRDCLRCTFDQSELADDLPTKQPRFERLRPYRYPWRIETEVEKSNLVEAIRAGIAIADLLKAKDKTDIGFQMDSGEIRSREPSSVPLLTLKDGKFQLSSTKLPHPQDPAYPQPIARSETVKKVRAQKRRLALKCEIVHAPTRKLQYDESEAPFYPVLVACREKKTDRWLEFELFTDYDNHFDEILECFANTLLNHHIYPNRIEVRDKKTYLFLEDFCRKAKIRLFLKDWHSALEHEVFLWLDSAGRGAL